MTEIVEGLERHAPSGSVVFFDNVHILTADTFERLRSEIRIGQDDGRIGGAIVYLARLGSAIKTSWRRDLQIPEVRLTCDEEWLACAFDLFAKRLLREHGVSPSSRAKLQWCSNPTIFARNLFVFSIALEAQRERIEEKPDVGDAVASSLRLRYLDGYSESVRDKLFRVSLLSQFGVAPTASSIDDGMAAFNEKGEYGHSLLDVGVVQSVNQRLRIVHPSLAALLVRASRPPVDAVAHALRRLFGLEPGLAAPLLVAAERETLNNDTLVSNLQTVLKVVREWLTDDKVLVRVLLSTDPQLWGSLVGSLSGGGGQATVYKLSKALEILFSDETLAARNAWLRLSSFDGLTAVARLFPTWRLQLLSELVADEAAFGSQLLRSGIPSVLALLNVLEQQTELPFAAFQQTVERLVGSSEHVGIVISRHLGGLRPLLSYLDRRAEEEGDATAGGAARALRRSLEESDFEMQLANRSIITIVQLFLYLLPFEDEESRRIAIRLRAVIDRLPAPELVAPSLAGLAVILGPLSAAAPEIAARIFAALADSDLAPRLILSRSNS